MLIPAAVYKVRGNNVDRFKRNEAIRLDYVEPCSILPEPACASYSEHPVPHKLSGYRALLNLHEDGVGVTRQLLGTLMADHRQFVARLEHCLCNF